MCVCASSGAVYAFDTHIAFICIHTTISCTILECRVVLAGWFSSLSNIYTWMRRCVQHTRTPAHSLVHTYTRCKYTVAAGVSIGSSIATDACCYAARATVSRFRLLRSSNFCSLPLLVFLPRVVPPLLTVLTEKRFSPFLPRDRALTLSPTRLGGGKHEAQQRRRGSRFFPLSFFSSLSLFLSSFFLYGRQYFRTNEAITIVISG